MYLVLLLDPMGLRQLNITTATMLGSCAGNVRMVYLVVPVVGTAVAPLAWAWPGWTPLVSAGLGSG